MKKMGNNIEFAVKNTVDDGMVVVVSWKLGPSCSLLSPEIIFTDNARAKISKFC